MRNGQIRGSNGYRMILGGSLLLGAALALVATAAIAGVASASSNVHSSVTIHFRQTQGNEVVFHGLVDASKPACVAHRTVVVKHDRPGKDKAVGDDRTRGDGRWQLDLLSDQLRRGEYYAHVKPKDAGGTTCLGARSREVHVF